MQVDLVKYLRRSFEKKFIYTFFFGKGGGGCYNIVC